MRFLHINLNNTNSIFQLPGAKKRNGCTFCYHYDEENEQLVYSIAFCGVKDAYVKQVGRDVAEAKWVNNERIAIPMTHRAFRRKLHNLLETLAFAHLNYTN